MYTEIIGPDTPDPNLKYATISVLPKSSFVGTKLFFEAYAKLMLDPKHVPEMRMPENETHSFGDINFNIGHFAFPKAQENIEREILPQWHALKYTEQIPWDNQLFIPAEALLSKEHRIVFIFRNPLDQVLSHYKFDKLLPVDDFLYKDAIDPVEFEEFVLSKALPAYIKMFYSFHAARDKYAQQILFVPYERLKAKRTDTLQQIIRFLNFPYNAQAFEKAANVTTWENLRKYEDQHGFIFGPSKHLRNGGVGVWQKYMTPAMVTKIDQELQKFGLNLSMFILSSDVLLPQFTFLQPELHLQQKLRYI